MSTQTETKTLNSEQVNAIRIIVVTLFIVVIGAWFYIGFYSQNKSSKLKNEVSISTETETVVYRKNKLNIFGKEVDINTYPDTVSIHNDELIVAKPYETKTYIYSLKEKGKVKIVDGVLLDYISENILLQKDSTTYFNSMDLGIRCDKGFISSASEILCIVKLDPNAINNKLISINPSIRAFVDVYSSENVLTSVFISDGETYIGEYNFDTNQAYFTINGESVKAPDAVNIIYSKGKSIYTGSFPGKFNNETPSYARLEGIEKGFSNNVKGEILLFDSE